MLYPSFDDPSPPLLYSNYALRHLILFSPPHTIKQLQDSAYHCGAMDWLHFGACSPPVAITQPRSQEKEDTSWMSTSIAAEANAVGSSAAPHIRDSCRDLFFLLSSPASIEHYLIPLLPQSLSNSNRRPSSTLSSQAPSTPSSIDTHVRCLPRSLCSTPSTSPTSTSRLSTSQHTSLPRPSRGTNRPICCRRSSSHHPRSGRCPRWTSSPTTCHPQPTPTRTPDTPMDGTRLISGTSPTKTSPRTTSENIDARPESPSEQTKDDPQHTTQHPLPNPFRAHSDDTVKWTAEDADGSGRDLGDPLSLADWDRAMSQAKKDGLDVKEGENMSKLHYFEHTATTFLHTLIRDNIPAHPHPRQNTERAEREGRSFQTRQVNSQALEDSDSGCQAGALASFDRRKNGEGGHTDQVWLWGEVVVVGGPARIGARAGRRLLGDVRPRNDSGHHHKHAPPSPAGHPPACADSLPPATRVHVFAVAREGGRVLYRRADGGERPCPLPRQSALCRERSAERPPALSAEQLEATPAAPHIDTMRGIDDCSQFAISLFAVSNPLLLAEELMKRIECLGRLFGYLEQGLADQSVSLIHTIQRTAAGRESSEQFAEHAEFELLVIDT
ncbi:hypothetical protein BLNAU_22373 [Blattamonas nauphoetae]|uniref:Uncharacterized protein n=1 Tax=Blattamonas nauphoetae TaxID=2049346 RepID=A0ABQ9WTR0_9EUKA|nr:hypothetical protein BLNAU_22373 [Blattamonas nauphoetae]